MEHAAAARRKRRVETQQPQREVLLDNGKTLLLQLAFPGIFGPRSACRLNPRNPIPQTLSIP